MKTRFVAHVLSGFLVMLILFLAASGRAVAQAPGSVVVHGKFGGLIFGFDIDPNGTEGILSEAVIMQDGTVLAAAETFDQATGKIIKVLAKSQTHDDFVGWGVSGNHVGLVGREHVISPFNVERTYLTVNPLDGNKLTAPWTPPIGSKHIVTEVKRDTGSNDVAVLATDVSGRSIPFVFRSNVASNTFGPIIKITDTDFNFETDAVLAFDSVLHQAILGHATNSPFIVPPKIGRLDLDTGRFHKFMGRGLGVINGIAVDSADGIACTVTSFDSSVQFYDLATETGTTQHLPGNGSNSLFAGQDIQFDPINKLFLVAQPFTSTGVSGSSIQVYDTQGNFIESIDGLSFNGESNVFPVHVAINPALRTGYVDGPDLNVTDIQSFTY